MTVANNSAMPVASPAQGDVAMTEAAPVSEIVKDVAAVLHGASSMAMVMLHLIRMVKCSHLLKK